MKKIENIIKGLDYEELLSLKEHLNEVTLFPPNNIDNIIIKKCTECKGMGVIEENYGKVHESHTCTLCNGKKNIITKNYNFNHECVFPQDIHTKPAEVIKFEYEIEKLFKELSFKIILLEKEYLRNNSNN
jgi:hypothetical protein